MVNKDGGEKLGRRLREVREYQGYSQEEIADCLNIPKSRISQIENGEKGIESSMVRKLANIYDVEPRFLKGDGEVSFDSDKQIDLLARTKHDLTSEDKEEIIRFARFIGLKRFEGEEYE